MLKDSYKSLKEYQDYVGVNLFGERDGYKMFGSHPAILVFSVGVICILSYTSY